ncbi:MAG: hypothetical protein ACLT2Z_08330, partial [Eubacterium sp.]
DKWNNLFGSCKCKGRWQCGHIQIWGRVQSREYVKKINEDESEKHVAYEVSVSKLEYIDE